jgi:hypothetical protein
MAPVSTQPLTKMNTRAIPGEIKGCRAYKTDITARHLRADFADNVVALTSHNSVSIHGLLQGQI